MVHWVQLDSKNGQSTIRPIGSISLTEFSKLGSKQAIMTLPLSITSKDSQKCLYPTIYTLSSKNKG